MRTLGLLCFVSFVVFTLQCGARLNEIRTRFNPAPPDTVLVPGAGRFAAAATPAANPAAAPSATTVAGGATTLAGAATTVAGAATTVAGAATTVAGAVTTVAGATTTAAMTTTSTTTTTTTTTTPCLCANTPVPPAIGGAAGTPTVTMANCMVTAVCAGTGAQPMIQVNFNGNTVMAPASAPPAMATLTCSATAAWQFMTTAVVDVGCNNAAG